jgi:hypothetical protein
MLVNRWEEPNLVGAPRRLGLILIPPAIVIVADRHLPTITPLFWRFAETVEKGPRLAGFFVSARIDPGIRSRKCGNFDLWSPVPKFPFLVRFLLFAVSCAARPSFRNGPWNPSALGSQADAP